ncbi:MAG: hypothetical protein Q8N47_14180 [Bryobacterales bacterium]|nr:hypothetical protein [Bryobacterales bacterium]
MRVQFIRFLDNVANWASIVVCLVVLITVVDHYAISRSAERRNHRSVLGIGLLLPRLPGVGYDRANMSVLVFLSGKCIACTESQADYVQLLEAAERSEGRVRIIAVLRESVQSIEGFNARLPSIEIKDFAAYGVFGTPTVVVVDNKGIVRDFWIGRLTKNAKGNLFAIMNREE